MNLNDMPDSSGDFLHLFFVFFLLIDIIKTFLALITGLFIRCWRAMTNSKVLPSRICRSSIRAVSVRSPVVSSGY